MAEKQQTPSSGNSQTRRTSELSVRGAIPYVVAALVVAATYAAEAQYHLNQIYLFFVLLPPLAISRRHSDAKKHAATTKL
jgi:hypothetical protein